MSNKQEVLFAPAATDSFAEIGVQGDSIARLVIGADGKLSWGPGGNSALDTVISRLGAGVLDVTTGSLSLNGTTLTATAAELNAAAHTASKIVNCTASTLTLSEALHGGGRIVTINAAAGCAITLPAATGSGSRFELFIGTTITSNTSTIKVANSSDTMVGFATIYQDAGNTALLFELGGTDDTLTMDGSTKGGIKGDTIRLVDIAANLWRVEAVFSGTGTEVVNNSATV